MNLEQTIQDESGLYTQIGGKLERCVPIKDAVSVAQKYAEEMQDTDCKSDCVYYEGKKQ